MKCHNHLSIYLTIFPKYFCSELLSVYIWNILLWCELTTEWHPWRRKKKDKKQEKEKNIYHTTEWEELTSVKESAQWSCQIVPKELSWSLGSWEISFDGLCVVCFVGFRMCVHPWCLSEWVVFRESYVLRVILTSGTAFSLFWLFISYLITYL